MLKSQYMPNMGLDPIERWAMFIIVLFKKHLEGDFSFINHMLVVATTCVSTF
jgi:hypothetical protein